MTGEVKKLPKAIAILRRRHTDSKDAMEVDGGDAAPSGAEEFTEELEMVEIIRYKILFASRPEPVGD